MINETLQNVTGSVAQAVPALQSKWGMPPVIVQQVGGTVHNVISGVLPGREWLGVLVIAALLAGLVVKKLREGVISLTTLWVSATLVLYLALKYVGL